MRSYREGEGGSQPCMRLYEIGREGGGGVSAVYEIILSPRGETRKCYRGLILTKNLISSRGVTIFLTWDLNIVRRIVIILTFSMISPAKQFETPKFSRCARIFSVGVLIFIKS